MNYKDLIDGLKRFGSTERDICIRGFGITEEHIRPNVIIAPWWQPQVFMWDDNARLLTPPDALIKVWDINYGGLEFTYIKAAIGAPVLMDTLLSLGVTKCEKIIFIGSVGALDNKMSIGDIVIPEYSVCGDGASRYIATDILKNNDIFGQKTFPDKRLFENTKKITQQICTDNNINWHIGKVFSIDTIFAQFAHIDEILRMGCNAVEMETAAAFGAAGLMNIPIVALLSVSDNTLTNKSLVCGRTEEEMEYRKHVRREIFPKIILSVLAKVQGEI